MFFSGNGWNLLPYRPPLTSLVWRCIDMTRTQHIAWQLEADAFNFHIYDFFQRLRIGEKQDGAKTSGRKNYFVWCLYIRYSVGPAVRNATVGE